MELECAAIVAPVVALCFVEANIYPVRLYLEVLGKTVCDSCRDSGVLRLRDHSYTVEVNKAAEIGGSAKGHLCLTDPRHAVAHWLPSFLGQDLTHVEAEPVCLLLGKISIGRDDSTGHF